MKKIVIFNVGGAMSAYADINGKRYIMDIGAGNNFSPVKDFLLPLYNAKFPDVAGRHDIDQLLISHLDADHISDYKNFDEYFHPYLLTVPSDHPNIAENLKVSRDKIADNETVDLIMQHMRSRHPGDDDSNPIWVCDPETMLLSYIPAEECDELDRKSDSEYPNYKNNLSLILHVRINGHSILFTGDIMKDGMNHLLETNDTFKDIVSNLGVDILIAPHHGLDTSFPNSLFQTIKNNKVRLNIISEKKNVKSDSDNRHNVDTRYYSSDFSTGMNVLNGQTGTQYGVITSPGHIVIDFDTAATPVVKRVSTNEDLIAEFI